MVAFVTRSLPSAVSNTSHVYGRGRWIAVGTVSGSNATMLSISDDDGQTWIQRSLPTFQYGAQIGFGNGVFLVLPSYGTTCLVSQDGGETWAQKSLPANYYYGRGIAFSGGLFAINLSTSWGGNNSFTSEDFGGSWVAKLNYSYSQLLAHDNGFLGLYANTYWTGNGYTTSGHVYNLLNNKNTNLSFAGYSYADYVGAASHDDFIYYVGGYGYVVKLKLNSYSNAVSKWIATGNGSNSFRNGFASASGSGLVFIASNNSDSRYTYSQDAGETFQAAALPVAGVRLGSAKIGNNRLVALSSDASSTVFVADLTGPVGFAIKAQAQDISFRGFNPQNTGFYTQSWNTTARVSLATTPNYRPVFAGGRASAQFLTASNKVVVTARATVTLRASSSGNFYLFARASTAIALRRDKQFYAFGRAQANWFVPAPARLAAHGRAVVGLDSPALGVGRFSGQGLVTLAATPAPVRFGLSARATVASQGAVGARFDTLGSASFWRGAATPTFAFARGQSLALFVSPPPNRFHVWMPRGRFELPVIPRPQAQAQGVAQCRFLMSYQSRFALAAEARFTGRPIAVGVFAGVGSIYSTGLQTWPAMGQLSSSGYWFNVIAAQARDAGRFGLFGQGVARSFYGLLQSNNNLWRDDTGMVVPAENRVMVRPPENRTMESA